MRSVLMESLANPWAGVATCLGIETSATCSTLYAIKGAPEWLQATLALVFAATIVNFNVLIAVLVLRPHSDSCKQNQPRSITSRSKEKISTGKMQNSSGCPIR